jgi:hypothetical protein
MEQPCLSWISHPLPSCRRVRVIRNAERHPKIPNQTKLRECGNDAAKPLPDRGRPDAKRQRRQFDLSPGLLQHAVLSVHFELYLVFHLNPLGFFLDLSDERILWRGMPRKPL